MDDVVGLTLVEVIGVGTACSQPVLRPAVLGWWVGRADLCYWNDNVKTTQQSFCGQGNPHAVVPLQHFRCLI